MGLITERYYTADDLLAVAGQPEYADLRLDLIEGTLYVMAPANWEQGDITNVLAAHLMIDVQQHRLGRGCYDPFTDRAYRAYTHGA